MNDNAQPSAAKVSARRRLLRGAFSAPAVLTLYSGSALATASSQRCLANQNGAAATPTPTTGTDSWYRVQLYKKSTGSTHWVVGSSLPVNRSGSPTLPANGQAAKFGVDSTVVGEYNKMYTTPGTTPSGVTVLSGKYAALRFDSNGLCVGIGATGGGSAIAQSCWNSFVTGGA